MFQNMFSGWKMVWTLEQIRDDSVTVVKRNCRVRVGRIQNRSFEKKEEPVNLIFLSVNTIVFQII